MRKLILFILISFFIACGDDDNQSVELYVDTDLDGFSEEEGDCDDNNSEINPNATEICDGVDNNCDGQIDEGLETLTYYMDNDNDGFGDINNPIQSCVEVDDYVINSDDCDDNNSEITPNATEICDGVDNNCDGQIDEGLETLTYYMDNDNDGFGDINNPIQSCVEVDGYVINSDDCDDNNSEINPNATEICDGVDNNCDGQIDDQCNTPPYISDAYIEPNNPTINDILACYIGAFEDIDGDTVTFSYQWFVNNVSIDIEGNTLSNEYFEVNDSVFCVVTAYDGIDNSPPAQTNTVVISE